MKVGRNFCGRCGQPLRPAARFCGDCGHPVPESAGRAHASMIAARLPPTQAPPGGGPPRTKPPGGPACRPVFLLPAVVVLAILLAGGGFTAALALIRYFDQPVPDSLAAGSPRTASSTSSSLPPPPTQVAMEGATVGISAVNTDPDATAVAGTLATYFGGIDTRKYTQAWGTYTAVLQAAIPFHLFSAAVSTSQDSQVVVQSIQHDANGNIEAHVSFQSHQAGQYGPSQGETCTSWSLDYHLVPAAATIGPVSLAYLINKVTDIGAGHSSC
jgi:hypothetical protein